MDKVKSAIATNPKSPGPRICASTIILRKDNPLVKILPVKIQMPPRITFWDKLSSKSSFILFMRNTPYFSLSGNSKSYIIWIV